ncbi:MAG: hypothetical protein ACK5LT_05465 [Lachnospirales bacterium]
MNKENYNAIMESVNGEALGDVKSIRIFKVIALEEVNRNALLLVLQEDINFALQILGEPEEILCQSVNLEKSIIILKHRECKTTHISVNLFKEEIKPNFKVEVVGDMGMLDYDSSKNTPVVLSNSDHKKVFSLCAFEEYSPEVKNITEKVMENL